MKRIDLEYILHAMDVLKDEERKLARKHIEANPDNIEEERRRNHDRDMIIEGINRAWRIIYEHYN